MLFPANFFYFPWLWYSVYRLQNWIKCCLLSINRGQPSKLWKVMEIISSLGVFQLGLVPMSISCSLDCKNGWRSPPWCRAEHWTCNPKLSGLLPVDQALPCPVFRFDEGSNHGSDCRRWWDYDLLLCFGKQSLPIESASMTLVMKYQMPGNPGVRNHVVIRWLDNSAALPDEHQHGD